MGFKCGIVGLPNVGKSSLFNALIETAAAESANFPFTTIAPNVGRIGVKDPRLDAIAALSKSAKITPTQLDVVDIAGLVKGASKGEGLGNRFLANIREVDAILHVLRCFEDANVTHVMGGVDPNRDADIVETELLLSDLESLERRVETRAKQAKGGDKEAKAELALMERTLAVVREGKPARTVSVVADEAKMFQGFQLLTAKPVLYVCNVEEESAAAGNAHARAVAERAKAQGAQSVVVSARIEQEVAELADPEERRHFLESVGLKESGLDRVVRAGHGLLGLITFFTTGPKESRAWTIPAGTTAARAAGTIHTDFERGFIAAETIAYDDFIQAGGEKAAKDLGRMRLEGRDYVVKDGDVMLFRFNV